MSARLRGYYSFLFPLFILIGGLGLRAENPAFLQNFQLKIFDLYQQIMPREPAAAPVMVIDIDDQSLSELGQWPWPRHRLALILAKLFEAGAEVVAFDVVFAEPDQTSPPQILSVWMDQDTLDIDALPEEWRDFSNAILASIPDHDDVLAEVIQQTRVVAGYSFTNQNQSRVPRRIAGISYAGSDPEPFLANFSDATTNISKIEQAAAGVGNFNLDPDSDNIVRRLPLVSAMDGEIYPSLVAEALRVYQGAGSYILKSAGASGEESFGESTGLTHLKIGRLTVPVDAGGSMWLHYTPEAEVTTLPAWQVFHDQFAPEDVAGKILFIGTSAVGLKDLRSTPVSPVVAGVNVHATAVSQILLNHYLSRPDFADGLELTLILAVGLLIIVLTRSFGAGYGAIAALFMVTGATALSFWLFGDRQWLLDPLYPSLVIAAVFGTASVTSYLTTSAEKKQVRGAFQHYLSPALVEQLAAEPDRLRLGGEMRRMTFLFCDVRGFTKISETFKSNPQGLTQLINRFLTPMTDVILARQGTIDKYMGDCIMAFWNAPLTVETHEACAAESALEMMRVIDELNDELAAEAEEENREALALNIGIGLNTGECVVGNMGSAQRFDYSVLGDAVNLASRLEGQSKTYGVDIVIGEETAKALEDHALIELDLIAVKGKSEAVRIFALIGDVDMAKTNDFCGWRSVLDTVIAAYRDQDWDKAETYLTRAERTQPKYAVFYALYRERIAHFRTHPPGADWDGVFVATSK